VKPVAAIEGPGR